MVSYLILYTVITCLPLSNSAKFQLIQVSCPYSSPNEQNLRTCHAEFVFFCLVVYMFVVVVVVVRGGVVEKVYLIATELQFF